MCSLKKARIRRQESPEASGSFSRLVVEERASGPGLDLDVARDSVTFELLVEFAPGPRGEVLFVVRANDWAGARPSGSRLPRSVLTASAGITISRRLL